MDEPTAALGVKEPGEVLNLIRSIRDRVLPVILISHTMPHTFSTSPTASTSGASVAASP